MLNRSKTWAAVLLAATFIAGLAVGAGSRALWLRRAHAGSADRGRGVDRMMAELTEELRLTRPQQDSVHAILQRHWTHMSALWDKVRPPFDTIRARMDSEVATQLTPEQQAKYRDHVARYRHHTQRADSGGNKR